jgi:YcxB-like protein
METQFTSISFVYDCNSSEQMEASRILALEPGQRASGRSGPGPREPSAKRGFVGWILFIGLAVMLFFLVNRNAKSTVSVPDVPTPWPVTVAEAVLALGVLLFLIGWQKARGYVVRDKRKWDGQKTYTITLQGLAQHHPGREEFYNWGYFIDFDESKWIFVLRTQRSRGMVIPKRLFADEAQRAQFRELLVQKFTRQAIPTAFGFPVIQ